MVALIEYVLASAKEGSIVNVFSFSEMKLGVSSANEIVSSGQPPCLFHANPLLSTSLYYVRISIETGESPDFKTGM